MRIQGFTIDEFGELRQANVAALPPGLCPILGDNEAGKSTCATFLRQMLFGFESRGNALFPQKEGGNSFGGLLRLATASHGEWVLERRRGAHGGTVTLSRAGQEALGADLLPALLGHLDAAIYRNVFAFSLTELQALEAMSDDNLLGSIHAASAGAGIQALPNAEKALQKALDELFLKRGQKQRLNQLIEEYESARERLRECGNQVAEFEQVSAALIQERQGLAAQQARRETLVRELRRLHGLVLAWEPWQQVLAVERELASLAPVPPDFPADGLTVLAELERDRADLARRAEDLASSLRLDRDRAERERPDPRCLAVAERLQQLCDRRAAYRRAGEELPRCRAALAETARGLERITAELGPGWNADRLRQADGSLAVQDELARHARDLRLAEENDRHLRDRRKERAGELAAAQRQAAELLAQLGGEAELPTVARLCRDRQEALEAMSALAARQQEQQDLLARLTEALAQLGPGWTPAALRQVDRSLAAQSGLANLQRQLAAAAAAGDKAAVRVEAAERLWREAQAQSAARTRELAALPRPATPDGESARQRQERAVELASALAVRDANRNAWDQLRASLAALPATEFVWPVWGAWGVAGLAVLTGAGSLWAWLAGQRLGALTELIPALGFTALAVAAWAWRRQLQRRGREREERLERLRQQAAAREAELANLDRLLAQNCRELGLETVPDRPACDRLILACAEDLRHHENLAHCQQELTLCSQREEALARELKAAREAAAALDAESALLNQKWETQLAALQLPPGTPVELGERIFLRIEQAHQLLAEATALAERVNELAGRVRAFTAAAQALPCCRPQPPATVAAWRETCEALNAQYLAWQRLRPELAERERAAAELNAQAAAAAQTLAEVQGAWRRWLAAQGWRDTLEPDSAQRACQLVGEGRRLLDAQAAEAARQEQFEAECAAFAVLLTEVAAALETPVPAAESWLALVETFATRLAEARQRDDAGREIARRLERDGAQLAEWQVRLAKLDEGLAELLARGQAATAAVFRESAERRQRGLDLQRERERLERELARFGGEGGLPALRRHLAATDLAAIEAEEARLQAENGELEQALNAASERRAALQLRHDGLLSSGEHAERRAAVEQLRAELDAAARQWVRLTLGRQLLDRAKQRFEAEHQPRVLQYAGTFLRAFTGGVYERVVVDLESRQYLAITPDGRRRPPEKLSRGTLEQLFLALRFGYIRHYSESTPGEKLPVLMDDILVNFDPTRAAQAVRAICELAASHQVLFFTCHPRTVELFLAQAPGTPVLRLVQGRFVTGT